MKTEYYISYTEHTIMGNDEYDFYKKKTVYSIEEAKEFIKTLKPEDNLKSITKVIWEKLDLKDFEK